MQAWKGKVYSINFSKPSLHFLSGKLEFIMKNNKKHKKIQARKEENKIQKPSNFQSKDSCKFFNANWLIKTSSLYQMLLNITTQIIF
jgi:hypothetical protein